MASTVVSSFVRNMRVSLISIEGNIGSGKSTFIQQLRAREWPSNVKFLDEPVKEWESIYDSREHKTMLEMFYEDQDRNAFSFQMMAYITRLAKIREAIRSYTGEDTLVLITERCLLTDRNVFAKMLYDSGKIREVDYKIYTSWFDEFIRDIPEPIIIYVKANPSVCHSRIHTRSRAGEESIPLSYLSKCHDYHNEWISTMSYVYELNGNYNKTSPADYNDWCSLVKTAMMLKRNPL
jgi:deoxyadenosine/deoxycytidine kinase